MKKLISLLLVCASLFAFNSCKDDDGYSLDKFWIARATVNSTSPGVYSFTLDDGTTLWPAAGLAHYEPRDGQRTYINFTILSDKVDKYDHHIRLNNVQHILTKSIVVLTPQTPDVYGSDPVKILSMDAAGDHLNIDFGFNYGGNKKHFVNLVQNTTVVYPKDNRTYLEFRHNAYGDPAQVGVRASVSFPIKQFQNISDESRQFAIIVHTFEGVKTYDVTYNWKNPTKPKEISDWSVLSKGIE